jgi:hypothetical protein
MSEGCCCPQQAKFSVSAQQEISFGVDSVHVLTIREVHPIIEPKHLQCMHARILGRLNKAHRVFIWHDNKFAIDMFLSEKRNSVAHVVASIVPLLADTSLRLQIAGALLNGSKWMAPPPPIKPFLTVSATHNHVTLFHLQLMMSPSRYAPRRSASNDHLQEPWLPRAHQLACSMHSPSVPPQLSNQQVEVSAIIRKSPPLTVPFHSGS